MINEQDSKPSVFMIVNSNLKDGTPKISSFVMSQAESLRSVEWRTFFGVVDDRTSIRGILRNIKRLKRDIPKIKPGLVHAQYGSVTAAVAHLIRGSLPLVALFAATIFWGHPFLASSGVGAK